MNHSTFSSIFSPPTRLGAKETSLHLPQDEVKDVEIVAMKYRHIPKVAKMWTDAFEHDPVVHYCHDTPDFQRGPFYKIMNKVFWQTVFPLFISRDIVLTIDGSAVANASYAKNSPSAPHGPIKRLVDFIERCRKKFLSLFRTSEQKKRAEEVESKVRSITQETIGHRMDDMMYVGGLASAPASQGKGYGGALLDAVMAIADSQGRATWLNSSNLANTKFYYSHGFLTVGEIVLGDTNPTWHEPPTVAYLMVREPRPRYDSDKKVSPEI